MSHGSPSVQVQTELWPMKRTGVFGMRTEPLSIRLLARCHALFIHVRVLEKVQLSFSLSRYI